MPQGEVLNVKKPPAQFSKQILHQLINLVHDKNPGLKDDIAIELKSLNLTALDCVWIEKMRIKNNKPPNSHPRFTVGRLVLFIASFEPLTNMCYDVKRVYDFEIQNGYFVILAQLIDDTEQICP